MPRDVGVVVVAAGRGERLGGSLPKQFQLLGGVPLLLWALRPFLTHSEVTEVIAVLPAEAVVSPPAWLAELLGERLRAVPGGATRMDSVEAGLGGLRPGSAVVLVHDGARPFSDRAVIDAVIAEARRGGAAVAAVPLSDTLKEAEPTLSGRPARILRTVPRSALWRAQTPQGFPRALLEAAYAGARAAGFEGSDDASLVERAGAAVSLVPDLTTNLKVTTPDDFRLAEAYAAARR